MGNRPVTSQDGFAGLLKSWRSRKRISQHELATSAGMSQRHLSFLETGRSKPSRYAIWQLGDALGMPTAERDMLLLSAGFLPLSANTKWSADTRAAVDIAVAHMLNGHEPYPAVSIDRLWNLKQANKSAELFFELAGFSGHSNLLIAIMTPGLLRDNIQNWEELVRGLYHLLELEISRRPHDDEGKALLQVLNGYPDVTSAIGAKSPENPAPVVVIEILIDDCCLRLFSMIATIGMSLDATLDDLRIETLFPADESTRKWFE